MKINNGWTGGQYSLFRLIFGAYLMCHFAQLIPWGTETFSNAGVLADKAASPLLRAFPNILALYDGPIMVGFLLISSTLAALCFSAGKFDRISALWMWYTLACLFGRNPLTSNPSLPFVGWMLVAHCFIPRAPYGSLQAHGRPDPDNGWKFPSSIFMAGWIIMALSYTYSGYTKVISPSWLDGSALRDVLLNPLARDTSLRQVILTLPDELLKFATWSTLLLELLFAPLALSRRLRPLIWTAMLLLHCGLLVLIDFADLTLGMIMIHAFTFDPNWVKPLGSTKHEDGNSPTLFYDGNCALCHGAVRFLLAEDQGQVFRFAPLQSKAFRKAIGSNVEDAQLPDSIVVSEAGALEGSSRIFVKSDAVARTLEILGGYWKIAGLCLRLLPKRVRDIGYRCVARLRYKIFGSKSDSCPLMSASHRSRFILDGV